MAEKSNLAASKGLDHRNINWLYMLNALTEVALLQKYYLTWYYNMTVLNIISVLNINIIININNILICKYKYYIGYK